MITLILIPIRIVAQLLAWAAHTLPRPPRQVLAWTAGVIAAGYGIDTAATRIGYDRALLLTLTAATVVVWARRRRSRRPTPTPQLERALVLSLWVLMETGVSPSWIHNRLVEAERDERARGYRRAAALMRATIYRLGNLGGSSAMTMWYADTIRAADRGSTGRAPTTATSLAAALRDDQVATVQLVMEDPHRDGRDGLGGLGS